MFKNFFRGRYGIDTLGFALVLIALILSRLNLVWIIGAGLFLYAVFRMLSKDTNKRFQEQQKFNIIIQKFMKLFSREGIVLRRLFKSIQSKYAYRKMTFQQRNQFEFFKCPKCSKNLRLPKNKGKLQVTCPVCGFEFIKKT
jgi:DNA-directed RNA polymerase subunit RPC12/RpoP